jgi:solute:Na+ symporter, SSS family
MNIGLSAVDGWVASLYVLGVIIFGLLFRLNITTVSQQFLSGRQARWPMVGFTLFAATVSSAALVGVTGSAYAEGVSIYNYDWTAVLVLTLFCAVILPTYLNSGVFTVPEFLEKRYGRLARGYVSGLSIILMTFVDTAGLLFAGSLLFKVLFPALSLLQVGTALSLCAGLFLVIGGLRAVMITDIVQVIILIGACGLMSILTLNAVGGFDALMAGTEPSRLMLIRPASDDHLPWTGLVTGLPLIGFYFWCTNQYMVQKVLAAKSLDHGRWGSLFAGGLKLTTIGLLIIPALCAPLLFPKLSEPDTVFFTLIFKLLPQGLIGLVIGVFLVTILSALAANYNAAATLVTLDFLKRYRPNIGEKALLLAGRLSIFGVMVLSVMWLPIIGHIADTLWNYLQAMLSYGVPPIAAIFLLGIFWRRANKFGAAWGLTIGTILSLFLFIGVEVLGRIDLHFLVAAFIIFIVSTLTIIATSFLRPAPDHIEHLMFTRKVWDKETETLKAMPLYQNYRYISVALLLITILVISPWW